MKLTIMDFIEKLMESVLEEISKAAWAKEIELSRDDREKLESRIAHIASRAMHKATVTLKVKFDELKRGEDYDE